MIPFSLQGEVIELHQLLKAAGLVGSGGMAKMLIAEGLVKVDGQIELRKRCKIGKGQIVEYADEVIVVA